ASAAMCRDHQVAVTRMDDQVVDRHRRKALANRQPGVAAIQTHEQAKLGAREQQVSILRVLTYDVHWSLSRQVVCQGFPSSAVISGLEEIRLVVVVAVAR